MDSLLLAAASAARNPDTWSTIRTDNRRRLILGVAVLRKPRQTTDAASAVPPQTTAENY